MKKLIAMIGAAVMSFGLFAALDPGYNNTYRVPADFEAGPTNIVGYTDDGQTSVFTDQTGVYWFANNFPKTSAGLTDYEQPAEVAVDTIDNAEVRVLKIEADTANPMLRTFNATSGTKPEASDEYNFSRDPQPIGTLGLFADAKVKLPASEEAPQDFDGKIAVWLQVIPEEKDENGEVITGGSTNLMVTCGKLDSKFAPTVTNVAIKAAEVDVNPEEWHRVTIRSIDTINTGSKVVPGFVIYIDGVLAQAAEGTYELPAEGLTQKATEFADKRALFASAEEGDNNDSTLESVGFAGNGSLSYIDLTDMANAPIFAQDPTAVTITWDNAQVESVKIGDVDVVNGTPFQITNFVNDTEIEIVYNGGFRGKSITAGETHITVKNIADDKMSATFTVDRYTADATLAIVSEIDRDEAWFTIGDEDAISYSSLQELLGVINDEYAEESRNIKIRLGESATLTGYGYLSGLGEGDGEIEIDLAGKTITCTYEVTGNEEDDTYLFWNMVSKMTIKDSVGGGAIIGAAGMKAIIYNSTFLELDDSVDPIAYTGKILNQCYYNAEGGEWGSSFVTVLGGKYTDKVTCEFVTDEQGQKPQGWEDHVNDGITLGTQAIPLKWSATQTDDFWTLEPIGAVITIVGNAGVTYTFTTNSETATSPAKIELGMDAAVIATLKEGYQFTNTTVEGWVFGDKTATFTTNDIDSASESIVITIPGTEKIPVELTLTAGGNTTLTADKAAPYVYGDEITVTAAPNAGYEFAEATYEGWEKNGANLVSNFVIKADTTITGPAATLITYEVAVAGGIENGTLETSVTNNVAPGTEVTVTATPTTGYALGSITTNGTAITGTTFVMPAEDVEVGATFTEIMVTAITLNKTELALVAGGSETLTATVTPDTAKDQTIAWTTSDAGVATVANGAVTAVAEGTATITATNAASGKFATCTVTVSSAKPVIPWTGAGTEESPWELNNAQAFADLKDWVEGEYSADVAGKFFKVTGDDIELTDWAGIGTSAKMFTGVIDGNGKTINVQFSSGKYQGLVGYAHDATIKDLTVNVTGFSSIGGSTGAAAFLGQGYNMTLVNLTATCDADAMGTVGAPLTHNSAGIFVKLYEGADANVDTHNFITACTNKMNIVANYTKVGGLGAFVETPDKKTGKTYITYTDCSNEGNLNNTYSTAPDCAGVGGIQGWSGQYREVYTLVNCRNIGTLTATAVLRGNVFGYAHHGVEAVNGTYVGVDELKAFGSSDGNQDFFRMATPDTPSAGLVTFAAVSSTVAEPTTYKVILANSLGFTLTDPAASLTIVTNFAAYTGTVAVDDTLTGYELNVSGDETKVVYTAALKTFDVTFKPENGSADIVSNDVVYGTAFADVVPKDLVKAGYEPTGWTPEGVEVTVDATYTAVWTPAHLTVTITLNGATLPTGWTSTDENVTATTNFTVESETFTLPELTKTDFVFEGYVKAGETATNKTVTITKGEVTASVSYTACFTAKAEEPDVPVDDPTALDEDGKKNAAEVAAEIAKGGTDVNTWVATVYGKDGTIPASKLNATKPEIIALAVANDLPITANEPTFEVSASTVTAESGNVAAFEFTLKDGATDVEIKTITEKVKAMVRYTSNLATVPFDQATDAQVDINALPAEGKIKVELKQTAANAGFMKVEPQPATTGGL